MLSPFIIILLAIRKSQERMVIVTVGSENVTFSSYFAEKGNLAAVINTAIHLQCCKITTRERYYCI